MSTVFMRGLFVLDLDGIWCGAVVKSKSKSIASATTMAKRVVPGGGDVLALLIPKE